jgi:hypothetical protein
MKKSTALLLLSSLTLSAALHAKTLRETDPTVYAYDVLFTNPTCTQKFYAEPVETNSGGLRDSKPENVFCTRGDRAVTAERDGSDTRMGKNESPQHRLLKLINDTDNKHIFMTYLSFSDSAVAKALCKRLAAGDLKLDLILDKMNEQGSIDRSLKRYLGGEELTRENRAEAEAAMAKDKASKLRKINKLKKKLAVNPDSEELAEKLDDAKYDYYKLLTKGQYLESELCAQENGVTPNPNLKFKRMAKPGGIGWSHTKLFMVNPLDKTKVTLSFSSANMSSGTTIHHENWHFVTASTKSHFVQSHLCLMDAEFDHASSKKEFVAYMKKCRANIVVDGEKIEPEDDIKTFFVPGDGEEAVKYIQKGIRYSKNVDMAAHRFTLFELKKSLSNATKDETKVRMVFDDDLYLVGEGKLGEGLRVPNMAFEYRNVLAVVGDASASLEAGDNAEARYLETNHFAHTIHHNKYLIMDNSRSKKMEPAVFAGAGNFTKAAFMMSSKQTNLENYYYITIPEVVEAFKKQYDYKWNKLATPYKDLPVVDVKPE